MRIYFIPNWRFWLLTSLLVALFILPVIAFAQDTAPSPETQPITPVEAGNLLLAAITAIVAGGLGGAPITAFFVGLLKHISALDTVSAPTLSMVVGGVLTALYWLASHFGYAVQFKSVSDFLLTAGPALIALLTTVGAASSIHKAAAKEQLAIVGYKRTPPAVG